MHKPITLNIILLYNIIFTIHITEAYEAYIKDHEVAYKTEVTTAVRLEPKVGDVPPILTNELEKEQLIIQRRMAKQTQMMQSFTSEQVCKTWFYKAPFHFNFLSSSNHAVISQEFQISSVEQRFMYEIECHLLKITYQKLLAEDGEQMDMTISEHECVSPAFSTPVKNYKLREGMSATLHFKMTGTPLPKVSNSSAST